MSLIVCPECGNEVSNAAAACPKCGFPFQAQNVIVEEPTVVRRPEVVVNEVVQTERSSFPTWVFVPVALALVLVIFGFLWLAQTDKEDANRAQANARLSNSTVLTGETSTVSTTQTATSTTATAPITSVPIAPTTGGSSITTTTLPPATSTVSSQTVTTTEAPVSTIANSTVTAQPASDKGTVRINATITNQRGAQQPVRREKFYLLKEDLETILSRANLESENGNYSSSLGVALVDPSKRAVLQQYLAAIKPYIVYSTTTDAAGAAQFKDVKPGNYHVFGVTRDGKRFAVWDTSVVVNAGENAIALNGNATPVVTEDVAESKYDN